MELNHLNATVLAQFLRLWARLRLGTVSLYSDYSRMFDSRTYGTALYGTWQKKVSVLRVRYGYGRT